MLKKSKLIPPTEKEEATINAGIAADSDTWEATENDFSRMRPAVESLPEMVEKNRKNRGRPPKENPKIQLSLRLSSETVKFFRSTGKGWQSKIDEVLKEYTNAHRKNFDSKLQHKQDIK